VTLEISIKVVSLKKKKKQLAIMKFNKTTLNSSSNIAGKLRNMKVKAQALPSKGKNFIVPS
jgi:hypothetical protein